VFSLIDKQDKERRSQGLVEVLEQRKEQAINFLLFMKRKESRIAMQRKLRIQLRDGYDSDNDDNYEIRTVTKETVIGKKKA
jgi:hypothetical protein